MVRIVTESSQDTKVCIRDGYGQTFTEALSSSKILVLFDSRLEWVHVLTAETLEIEEIKVLPPEVSPGCWNVNSHFYSPPGLTEKRATAPETCTSRPIKRSIIDLLLPSSCWPSQTEMMNSDVKLQITNTHNNTSNVIADSNQIESTLQPDQTISKISCWQFQEVREASNSSSLKKLSQSPVDQYNCYSSNAAATSGQMLAFKSDSSGVDLSHANPSYMTASSDSSSCAKRTKRTWKADDLLANVFDTEREQIYEPMATKLVDAPSLKNEKTLTPSRFEKALHLVSIGRFENALDFFLLSPHQSTSSSEIKQMAYLTNLKRNGVEKNSISVRDFLRLCHSNPPAQTPTNSSIGHDHQSETSELPTSSSKMPSVVDFDPRDKAVAGYMNDPTYYPKNFSFHNYKNYLHSKQTSKDKSRKKSLKTTIAARYQKNLMPTLYAASFRTLKPRSTGSAALVIPNSSQSMLSKPLKTPFYRSKGPCSTTVVSKPSAFNINASSSNSYNATNSKALVSPAAPSTEKTPVLSSSVSSLKDESLKNSAEMLLKKSDLKSRSILRKKLPVQQPPTSLLALKPTIVPRKDVPLMNLPTGFVLITSSNVISVGVPTVSDSLNGMPAGPTTVPQSFNGTPVVPRSLSGIPVGPSSVRQAVNAIPLGPSTVPGSINGILVFPSTVLQSPNGIPVVLQSPNGIPVVPQSLNGISVGSSSVPQSLNGIPVGPSTAPQSFNGLPLSPSTGPQVVYSLKKAVMSFAPVSGRPDARKANVHSHPVSLTSDKKLYSMSQSTNNALLSQVGHSMTDASKNSFTVKNRVSQPNTSGFGNCATVLMQKPVDSSVYTCKHGALTTAMPNDKSTLSSVFNQQISEKSTFIKATKACEGSNFELGIMTPKTVQSSNNRPMVKSLDFLDPKISSQAHSNKVAASVDSTKITVKTKGTSIFSDPSDKLKGLLHHKVNGFANSQWSARLFSNKDLDEMAQLTEFFPTKNARKATMSQNAVDSMLASPHTPSQRSLTKSPKRCTISPKYKSGNTNQGTAGHHKESLGQKVYMFQDRLIKQPYVCLTKLPETVYNLATKQTLRLIKHQDIVSTNLFEKMYLPSQSTSEPVRKRILSDLDTCSPSKKQRKFTQDIVSSPLKQIPTATSNFPLLMAENDKVTRVQKNKKAVIDILSSLQPAVLKEKSSVNSSDPARCDSSRRSTSTHPPNKSTKILPTYQVAGRKRNRNFESPTPLPAKKSRLGKLVPSTNIPLPSNGMKYYISICPTGKQPMDEDICSVNDDEDIVILDTLEGKPIKNVISIDNL